MTSGPLPTILEVLIGSQYKVWKTLGQPSDLCRSSKGHRIHFWDMKTHPVIWLSWQCQGGTQPNVISKSWAGLLLKVFIVLRCAGLTGSRHICTHM